MNTQHARVSASCPLSHTFPLAVPGSMPFHFFSLYFPPHPSGFHLFWLSPSLILFHGPALRAWTLSQMVTGCQRSCTWAAVLQTKALWMRRRECGIREPALTPSASCPVPAPLLGNLCRFLPNGSPHTAFQS